MLTPLPGLRMGGDTLLPPLSQPQPPPIPPPVVTFTLGTINLITALPPVVDDDEEDELLLRFDTFSGVPLPPEVAHVKPTSGPLSPGASTFGTISVEAQAVLSRIL